VIVAAVRWYLRYGLSYRDVEEPLAERGAEVDHVSVYRWVQRFTPLLADAARSAGTRPVIGGSLTRPTSRSMAHGGMSTGRWTSMGRSSTCSSRAIAIARPHVDSSAGRAVHAEGDPGEVVTDAAPAYSAVIEKLFPSAWHHVERFANNPIESDHARLKHRLRPMRGLPTDRTCGCQKVVRWG
jgi:hypothetical protein